MQIKIKIPNYTPVGIKIYHIFQKRRTALIIKIIKAGRYFLDGDIYQAISQLCCEILGGLVGAVA